MLPLDTNARTDSQADHARLPKPQSSALPRYLALAYSALIVYASLHPFSGWRDPGLPLLIFLDAGWPHYWTGFDMAVNIIAYAPLGFLLVLSLRRLPWRWLQFLLVHSELWYLSYDYRSVLKLVHMR